jgi:CBS domain-containing protein
MKVKDILGTSGRPVITITGDKTIKDAMELLSKHKIGSVVVVNQGGDPIGILTERDMFHLCYRHDTEMKSLKVADHMTTDLLVGVPEDDIDYIAGVITNKRVRHIPIIDENRKLCGLISIGDIVKAKMKQAEIHVRYLTEYITGRSKTDHE